MRTSPSTVRSTLAAAGLALLVLAGCSGGGSAQTGPTTTRPVDTSFTGANSAQFCALARTYNTGFTGLSSNATPAELADVARQGQAAITQAVAAAPAEIKPDVQVLATAFTSLVNELAKVNYDPAKLPATALAPLQAPGFQQATTRFQAYTRTVCGIAS